MIFFEKFKIYIKKVENASQLKEIQYKMKKTCLERYGVENPMISQNRWHQNK
jgi:hypothetical protein